MHEVRITVRGRCFAQNRHRFDTRNRRAYKGESQNLQVYKQVIQYEARKQMAGYAPFRRAIGIQIKYYFARSKHSKKKLMWYTSRPDLDNLNKAVFDAMTKVVYLDDALICQEEISKEYCEPGQERVEIFVYHLEDPENES